MRFVRHLRLTINNGMIRIFAEDPRRDLTAKIAIDACIVDEEIPWDVFRICAFYIGHGSILRLGNQPQRHKDTNFRVFVSLWLVPLSP